MNNNFVSQNQAAEIFLKKIIQHAVNGTINSVKSLLEKGPAGRKKDSQEVELHNWFLSLDEQSRKNVMTTVEKAIKLATFSSLVVIDNKTPGYPIENTISDFALYIQSYDSINERGKYRSSKMTRVNLSYTTDGDLHDEFLYMLSRQSDG
jgi:hypothetical protein